MSEDKKESLWYKLWDHRSKKEKQRLRSLIPYILYGIAVFYGIVYLSILNTVNRERTGTTVKTWFGGDRDEVIKAREREEKEIKEIYKDPEAGLILLSDDLSKPIDDQLTTLRAQKSTPLIFALPASGSGKSEVDYRVMLKKILGV